MLKQAPYRARVAQISPKKNNLSDRKSSDILSSKKGKKSSDTHIKPNKPGHEIISSMDFDENPGLYQNSILAMSHGNLPENSRQNSVLAHG